MASPNLGLTHWDQGNSQPEVLVSEDLDIIDRSLCGTLTHDMASDADYTLSNVSDPKEWQYLVIHITDLSTNLTAARNIIVPTNTKTYFFHNATAQTLTLKTSAGTGVAVTAGSRAILYCDGTNVVIYGSTVTDFLALTDTPSAFTSSGGYAVQVNSGATALEFVINPFDIGTTVGGTPTNSQECLRIPMVRAVRFPASMTGSQSKAGTASTGNVAFSLQKNGSQFGTITFNATATGVFAAATETTFAIGDQLTIVAPATADSTLADIGILLKGTRD